VSLTLLFDLDDTLMENSMAEFLPAYLREISNYLAEYVEPSIMINALMVGTYRMLGNQNPECTLADVFYPFFYQKIQQTPRDINPAIERFYKEIFPQLKSLTRPIPAAVRMVEGALARGFNVAIATAPLFPRQAIQQRLTWAGFNPEKHPFALIPSMDVFHFAKPNPAYLAELLAQLGWPEDGAVMVGNDPQDDIRAAYGLGLPSYWIQKDGYQPPLGDEQPSGFGYHEDLLPWLDSTPAEKLQLEYHKPSAMLAILRSTPAALSSLSRELPGDMWIERPSATEWSLTEIVCHLRDVDAEVNLPRLEKLTQQTNPFLPGQDTDRWAEERNYIQQDGKSALHYFTQERIKLLNLLENLTDDEWQHTARHAIFGPTTLQELVGFIVGHDRLHMRQAHDLARPFLQPAW
jgi:FMN phosphatase YigB (HAD superfamily)